MLVGIHARPGAVPFLQLFILALVLLGGACAPAAQSPTQMPSVTPTGAETASTSPSHTETPASQTYSGGLISDMPPTPSTLPDETPTATAAPAPTPTQTTAPTVVITPNPEAEFISQEGLWQALRGFSGKTNQQREAYIAQELFPNSGLTNITKQPVTYNGPWGKEYGNWDDLSNLLALRSGSRPDKQGKRIIVGGHFDKATYPGRSRTPGISDGILDNASGVAAVAKIAQYLKDPLNDIQFIAFASEEPQPFFNGSRAYFDNLPDKENVLVYINLDVLGRGNLALVENSVDPELAEIAFQVARDEKLPLVWRPASHQTNSDQLIAQANGLKVLAITSDEFEWYDIHVPEDNLSAVDPDVFHRQYRLAARIIIAIDRHFAQR